MSRKQTINNGWIILEPIGKDFNGKQVWITRKGYQGMPQLFDTKAAATRNKLRGEKVVRATVTTEWEEV